MSSDGYFDDDEFDSAFLREIDVIEATHTMNIQSQNNASTSSTTLCTSSPRGTRQRPVVISDQYSDEFDIAMEMDCDDLAMLDGFIADSYAGKARPVAFSDKHTLQTTLFGGTIPPQPPKSQAPRSQQQRTKSVRRNPFGTKAPKTKKWDHTEFAKSGWKRPKGKGKAKATGADEDMDDDGDEEVEFEQFPAPVVTSKHRVLICVNNANPALSRSGMRRFQLLNAYTDTASKPPPMRLKPDLLAAKDWIFPLNQPRRDYQFNIVKHCLFENTLVAIPTGLGKTFIAGVVMLNYYKWFPEGKVVFVAPTKPLVAQQVEACHKTCGIPGRDAVELTGQNPRSFRAQAWAEKRIFYMTPQTLMNDLSTDNCDPLDIILLVIDEAHKGTGDYAYAQVVRYLMAKNPHFRILALTATPGSKPETVQTVIDSLHISHIEIRDEKSLDLRPYTHEKEIRTHVIKMSDSILDIQKPLVELMNTNMKRLRQCGVLHCHNVVLLHPYTCTAAAQGIRNRPDSKQLTWAYPQLKIMGALARAIGYLMELSVTMCYTTLLDLVQGNDQDGKVQSSNSMQSRIREDSNFQKLMLEIEKQRANGFEMHPKMDKLETLVIDHFGKKVDNGDEDAVDEGSKESKVMVFVNFRECVDEVVEVLNRHQPMVRATRFIGQGKDKKGKMGIAQSEQLEVIKKFKNGEFNVLVATSIGEEGLDIGEIDRIICYESPKSSIRMLQRIGRTGRKRGGFVDVLLAEEREESNWSKSKENYEDVQQSIVRGDQLELYEDVERLLPDHIKPQCLQTVMEIEEYVRETKKQQKTLNSLTKSKRPKRNADVNRNIPLDAYMGFVTASTLSVKGPKEKKKKKADASKKIDDLAIDDDDVDQEIEGGLHGGLVKPLTSKAKVSRVKGKKQVVAPKKADQGPVEYPSSSQLKRELADDSVDMEIANGLQVSPGRRAPLSRSSESGSPASPFAEYNETENVDLWNSSPQQDSRHIPTVGCSPKCPLSCSPSDGPSPRSSPKRVLSHHTASTSQSSDIARTSAWLLDTESDSDVELIGVFPLQPPTSPTVKHGTFTIKHDEGSTTTNSIDNKSVLQDSAYTNMSPAVTKKRGKTSMPPPALPSQVTTTLADPSKTFPQPSFPVRGPQRKRTNLPVVLSSSPLDMPPPSQRRLKRRRESPPSPVRKKRIKATLPKDAQNLWLDMEAVHSGDEESEGDSDADMVETDSDRRFVQELPETQASQSYDQTANYRFGLMTQVPAGGPQFATKARRRGPFAGGQSPSTRRRLFISSSPERRDSELDEYDLGSFVVPDDDSILHSTPSSEH